MDTDNPSEPSSAEAPIEGLGAPNVDEAKRNLMQEVAALISINGGKVPERVEEFWYQVGLAGC
jgi:hypothetical protein